MGRFIFNHQSSNSPVDESRLRSPEADSDFLGPNYYTDQSRTEYQRTTAAFKPGQNNAEPSGNQPQNKLSYLKAEIDYMVDGFMRELLDMQAFSNLDSEIQNEIAKRYPQFFE